MKMKRYVDLFYDKEIFTWSKRLLSFSGLWPQNRSDVRFTFYIVYIVIFTSLELLALVQSFNDLGKTLRNVTLSLPTILIILKAIMFRWKMHLIVPVLATVERDITEGLYKSEKEREKVYWYNVAAAMFTTSSALSLFFVPTLFYCKPVLECVLLNFENCTLPYELPTRVNLLYEISDARRYMLFCFYLSPVSALLTAGATGADSLLVTLTFYLCSQFSILSSRMRKMNLQGKYYRHEMKVLVRRHAELLSLAATVRNSFSSLMLIQTVGLICSLCVVAYQLLTTTESGKDINTVHFIIYSCAVVLLAFCYCFLGECLIEESSTVDVACYFCNWYELPAADVRTLMFCIARSRKPSFLSGGKFYIFSLETFGLIMKASMAYLSVLRTVTLN